MDRAPPSPGLDGNDCCTAGCAAHPLEAWSYPPFEVGRPPTTPTRARDYPTGYYAPALEHGQWVQELPKSMRPSATILLALDQLASGETKIPVAGQYAKLMGAQIVLLHVLP